MRQSIILAALMLLWTAGKAQFFYNNGVTVYSEPGALIKVQGSVTNDHSGTIEHKGLIIIDSTFTNKTTAVTKGSGRYDVFMHWVNSGSFIRDTSTVNLTGLIQDIKGDSVTRYYNLNLQGTGAKRLFINSQVYNRLNLTTNELAAQKDTMFLQNPNTGSLLGVFTFGSEAFISNQDSGAFVRSTNSTGIYYYPMGNKSGSASSPRFRPVNIKPVNASANRYSMAFFNYSGTTDTYTTTVKDTSLCYVNDKFYHKMGRINGSSPADVEFGYLQASDGFFNTIGNWGSSWKDINSVTNTGMMGGYNSNRRLAWSNFTNLPYSLASHRPEITAIDGNNLVCGSSVSSYAFISNPAYSYDWSVNGGTFVNGDSTSQNISVLWSTPGVHQVVLTITDPNGCSSASKIYTVTVGTGPTAGFNLSPGPYTVGGPIFITDSSANAVTWLYNLGNGTSGSSANAQTVFGQPGVYEITQVVTDSYGCTDTLTKTIDISNTVLIPNVFTPNGDGKNDVFSFNCNGCSDYDLEINDRWGLKMYQGTKGSEFWDGTTASGEKVPDGTYFYILKIQYPSGDQLLKGFTQLFR